MENLVERRCGHCGTVNRLCIAEDQREDETIACQSCGKPVATVGQLHADVAQQALGLGATELRDDHVPVGGALGEQPNR